jgi:hypothetical protein
MTSMYEDQPADFDTLFYLAANEDVAKSRMIPVEHWRKFGKLEKRNFSLSFTGKKSIDISSKSEFFIEYFNALGIKILEFDSINEYSVKWCPGLYGRGVTFIEYFGKTKNRRYYLYNNFDFSFSLGDTLYIQLTDYIFIEIRNRIIRIMIRKTSLNG